MTLTYVTVYYFIIGTCYGTGGLYSVLLYGNCRSMLCQGQLLSRSADLMTLTYVTVYYFIIGTCYGTGGLYSVLLYGRCGSMLTIFAIYNLSVFIKDIIQSQCALISFTTLCLTITGIGANMLYYRRF